MSKVTCDHCGKPMEPIYKTTTQKTGEYVCMNDRCPYRRKEQVRFRKQPK